MKAILLVSGIILGSLFANEKLSTSPQAEENKTEIVYGHRIGPTGEPVLVTTR